MIVFFLFENILNFYIFYYTIFYKLIFLLIDSLFVFLPFFDEPDFHSNIEYTPTIADIKNCIIIDNTDNINKIIRDSKYNITEKNISVPKSPKFCINRNIDK